MLQQQEKNKTLKRRQCVKKKNIQSESVGVECAYEATLKGVRYSTWVDQKVNTLQVIKS